MRLIYYISIIIVLSSCKFGNKNSANKPEKDTDIIINDTKSNSLFEGMVLFESGKFVMGSNNEIDNSYPEHIVEIASFYIDKYPVTVAQFRKFIQETKYQTDAEKFGDSGVFDFKINNWALVKGANWEYPFGKNEPKAEDNHPVTHVSWNDATNYANWSGKRLPTEKEWEFAASCRGTILSKFSWGDELIVKGKYMANVWQGNDLKSVQGADGFNYTSPVGYFEETNCGMYDMGGNVWNWCSDTYYNYPGNNNALEINEELKVIRGGSFFYDQNGEKSFSVKGRASNTKETSLFNCGFRCAISAK